MSHRIILFVLLATVCIPPSLASGNQSHRDVIPVETDFSLLAGGQGSTFLWGAGGGEGAGDGSGDGPDGPAEDGGMTPSYGYEKGTFDEKTPYTNPEALCAESDQLTRDVKVIDTPAYSWKELVPTEWYRASPDDITREPGARDGIETMTWSAYRNGIKVASGQVDYSVWISAHGGYGRGEALIEVPGGFDSIVVYSNEVGSDGNIEFIRGVAEVPKFVLKGVRIVR